MLAGSRGEKPSVGASAVGSCVPVTDELTERGDTAQTVAQLNHTLEPSQAVALAASLSPGFG